ncbi:hypothetical protein [Sphingomonas sp. G-3-2-10]|uniref:hypothetical protein n=1 Tax=Sphingomonas sp. G-3-2-10 TaxID=2728838 RepID=UPI001469DF55|nr:hypothetical protein [Sphingomonas sp. G-3-2-10]NML05303.1 hypothetical protein [Sphingomonas sp. G-3-2-10]
MTFPNLPHRTSLRSGAAALLAGSVLAACSSPESNTSNTVERDISITEVTIRNEAAVTPAPEVAGNASGATIGGDGSEIVLNPLTAADVEGAKLEGELACSFATSASTAPLLLGKANVGPNETAWSVVKVSDDVEPLSAGGGFNAMVRGVTFSGKGKTIRIAPTGEKAAESGESPPVPATLTYDRADGARRVIEGLWTCGP